MWMQSKVHTYIRTYAGTERVREERVRVKISVCRQRDTGAVAALRHSVSAGTSLLLRYARSCATATVSVLRLVMCLLVTVAAAAGSGRRCQCLAGG